MRTQRCTLLNGERLAFSYSTGYKNLSIEQDGEKIATFLNPDDFRNGFTFKTKAGEKITLLIDHAGLAAWHNGSEILTGQKSGTIDYFTHAIWGTLVVGGFTFCNGLSDAFVSEREISESGTVEYVGFSYELTILLIIPIAMAGFAWWAKSSNQKLHLGLAMAATILGLFVGLVNVFFGLILVSYQVLGIKKGSLFVSNSQDDSTILDRLD